MLELENVSNFVNRFHRDCIQNSCSCFFFRPAFSLVANVCFGDRGKRRKRDVYVNDQSYSEDSDPTEPFTISKLQNPLHDISEQHKVCRSRDHEALK